jgi:hypothetical protein
MKLPELMYVTGTTKEELLKTTSNLIFIKKTNTRDAYSYRTTIFFK